MTILNDEMRAAVMERMGFSLTSVDPWFESAIEDLLAVAERQWQERYGDAYQAGWWRGQHELCPRCGVELEREVHGDQPSPARKGYETAIAVLRDVAERTGSPAAAWCADYLIADPDRLAPPPQ